MGGAAPGQSPTVAVVLPARDAAGLVARHLAGVVEQASAAGGEVIVVDDASRDDTARRAEHLGARVIRCDVAAGPYVARNAGWTQTDAPVVVFTDTRCSPDPGWLEAHLEATSRPEVVISGGDVRVPDEGSWSQRAIAIDQPFLVLGSMGHPFLPFFPTCNLAVRRADLEAVGGFRPLTSGGDLDLCWRLQLATGRQAVASAGATMRWEPRSGLRDGLRQFVKYGRALPGLLEPFREHGCELPEPQPLLRFSGAQLKAWLRGEHPRGPLAVAVAYRIANQWSYERAWRARRRTSAS